jgi:DmsE family decaheme c-type cytochrome
MEKRAFLLLTPLTGLALAMAVAPLHARQAPAAPEGSAICVSCHTDTVNAFKATPHAASAKGCEGCHGDSKAHVAAGGGKGTMRNFKSLSAADASAVCLSCHENKGAQKHWTSSAHDTRGVSCISCHDPHPKGAVPAALLAKPQFELCTTCHLQKKAALMRSSHMPMREGKMKCTSCHDPHGSPYPRQLLQVSVNQNCYSCHAEKRGPFLWEHAPVRENCLNCHDAHGTVNDYLLKVKQPMLCIQCHNGFAGGGMGNAHAARDRYALNQSCMNCHPMIHGSMHPRGNTFKR